MTFICRSAGRLENIRNLLPYFLKTAQIMIAAILAGYLLLIGAYSIPTERMQEHLKYSAEIFNREGAYPELIPGYGNSRLDNFTDALMLLTAAHESSSPAYRSSLYNERTSILGKGPVEVISAVSDEQSRHEMQSVKYGRYWHGYLVLLKPMLFLMGYGAVRQVNIFLQLMLLIWIAVLLERKNKAWHMVPLLMAWLFLNPAATMMSLQFTSIWMLVLGQILCFLIFEKKYLEDRFFICEHFLVAGCLTSYLDLLTYPAVAAGIPVLFWAFFQGGVSVQKDYPHGPAYMHVGIGIQHDVGRQMGARNPDNRSKFNCRRNGAGVCKVWDGRFFICGAASVSGSCF